MVSTDEGTSRSSGREDLAARELALERILHDHTKAKLKATEEAYKALLSLPTLAAKATASEPQTSEIPAADEAELIEHVDRAIRMHHPQLEGKRAFAGEIFMELRPYLRQPEPVSVSLGQMARKVQKHAMESGDDSPVDYGDAEGLTKVVLDAAGVKYAD